MFVVSEMVYQVEWEQLLGTHYMSEHGVQVLVVVKSLTGAR